MELKVFNSHCNAYVLIKGNEAVVIDCGIKAKRVFEYLDYYRITAKYLLLTHGHYDHCIAAHEYDSRDVKIYIGKEDMLLIQKRAHILPELIDSFVDFKAEYLTDGQKLNLCGMEFTAIHTPGHTEGGYSFIIDDKLFSGDTLFFETVGRTDLPSGDASKLKSSIARLFDIKGEYIIYPGHSRPTTLSHERECNLVAKSL